MCDRLNLPRSISDPANILFKKVKEGKTLKGRSNDAILSACLYIGKGNKNVFSNHQIALSAEVNFLKSRQMAFGNKI